MVGVDIVQSNARIHDECITQRAEWTAIKQISIPYQDEMVARPYIDAGRPEKAKPVIFVLRSGDVAALEACTDADPWKVQGRNEPCSPDLLHDGAVCPFVAP